MNYRPRVRRVLKWMSLAVAVLCGTALGTSAYMSIHQGLFDGRAGLGIDSGLMYSCWIQQFDLELAAFNPNLMVHRHKPNIEWWFEWHHRDRLRMVRIPLWVPFVLFGSVSALFWRVDRHVPPGHCPNCNYDLAGNVSGVCPECGDGTSVVQNA